MANNKINNQKLNLVIADDFDLSDYVECFLVEMEEENNPKSAVILPGEGCDKIFDILEKISNVHGGYDYRDLAPNGCYIKKSMINKSNVYCDEVSFLNDFPYAKKLYQDYNKQELEEYLIGKKNTSLPLK